MDSTILIRASIWLVLLAQFSASVLCINDHPNNTVLVQLRKAKDEALQVSPLACALIMMPVVALWIMSAICCCMWFRRRAKKRRGSSCPTRTRVVRSVVRSPAGQAEPIPLTGLVKTLNSNANNFYPSLSCNLKSTGTGTGAGTGQTWSRV